MPTVPPRFRALRNLARFSLFIAVLGACGAAAYGVFAWAVVGDTWGAAWIASGLSVLALGLMLYAHFSLTHKAVNNTYRSYDSLLDIAELLRRQGDFIRTIAENSSLSEWSKRIIYRERDYEYLRDTIHGATARQDWIAAERLIREVDEEFGLHEEAGRLRDDLEQARQATGEEKVAAALRRFESLCDALKWDQAGRESKRLQALFPSEPRIAGLPRELELRRQQQKRSLLKAYDEAVRAHKVNKAHGLLFELDQYLAPNEAAAMKQSARGVFKAKLQQMGVQFALAVTDKHFSKAIAIGQQLMREFPNSRMAQEIAEMTPALERRVTQDAHSSES